MGCSVTSAGSSFDTSWFAAAIELDGTVRNFNFPIGDSRELFDTGLKYLNKFIRTHRETKFLRPIFSWHTRYYQNSRKYCLTNIWSHMVWLRFQTSYRGCFVLPSWSYTGWFKLLQNRSYVKLEWSMEVSLRKNKESTSAFSAFKGTTWQIH